MTTPIALPPDLSMEQIEMLADTEEGRRLLRARGIAIPETVSLATVHVDPYLRRDEGGHIEQVSGYDYERHLLEAGLPQGVVSTAHFYGLNSQSQTAVLQSMADHDVDMRALMDEMVGMIGEVNTVGAKERLAEAAKWYPAANALARQIEKDTDGKITLHQAAAALAACSARCPWVLENGEGEVRYVPSLARFVADGRDEGLSPVQAAKKWSAEYKANNTVLNQKGEPAGAALMFQNAAKAIQVFRDASKIESLIGNNKERSFFNNIVMPGQTSDVTIDAHMFKVFERALGWSLEEAYSYIGSGSQNNAKDIHVSSYGYTVLAQAVRNVALLYGVAPDTVQSAYWLGIQPVAHITEKSRG